MLKMEASFASTLYAKHLCFNTEQGYEIAHAGGKEQGVVLTECERF
jgi:hypothetical protein